MNLAIKAAPTPRAAPGANASQPSPAEAGANAAPFADALKAELDQSVETPAETAASTQPDANAAVPAAGAQPDGETLPAGGNALPPFPAIAAIVAPATAPPADATAPIAASPGEAVEAAISAAAPAVTQLPDAPAAATRTATGQTAANDPRLPSAAQAIASAQSSSNAVASDPQTLSAIPSDPSPADSLLASVSESLASARTVAAGAPATEAQTIAPTFSHALASAATRAESSQSSVPTPTLAVPLHQPGWDRALGERVVWQVNQSLPSAQLTLNPPELGPLEVHIQLEQNEARVTFISAHGTVRDAVESALPRLREMLADAGLQLTDANVSSQSFAQSQRSARDAAAFGANTSSPVSEEQTAHVTRIDRGLVDLYA